MQKHPLWGRHSNGWAWWQHVVAWAIFIPMMAGAVWIARAITDAVLS